LNYRYLCNLLAPLTVSVELVSCENSDFTPCAHAQNDILHINYTEKIDD